MTWQERVKQLENDGKFAEASRLFAYSLPNASYVQKMKFGDKMFKHKVYREALYWYEECIGAPIVEEYYYFIDDPKYDKAKKQFLKKEYRRAMNEYRYFAQEFDDGYAMFMLGECYMHELANEYAYEHAVYWYQYALEHGNTYAYYPLGIAYQFGYGVEKDLKRAEELFEEGTKYAIDKDNCYCKLGNFCYERGEYEKAQEYYGKASVLNNARALLNTAIGYFNRDLKMDKSMVACLLAKSAALGNERAKELFYSLKKDGKL